MNSIDSCCGITNYPGPTKESQSCCECFPYNPISPTEKEWPKICDYFNLGDPAPKFTLEGVYENNLIKVSLEQYLGKWVALFFYNADFTFV